MGKKVKGIMSFLWWFAGIALILGGLNWGFVTWFDFNIVETLLGKIKYGTNVAYSIVGVSAVWAFVQMFIIKPYRK